MSGGMNFGTKIGIAAGLYGAYIALKQPSRHPANIDEARRNTDFASVATDTVRDIGIAVADDIPLLLGGAILAKRYPGYKRIQPFVNTPIFIAGGAIAGTFVGRDVNNYMTSKYYIDNYNNARNRSGNLIDDKRVGSISGFNNQGLGGTQRMGMTGIASPSSQGIMYRMDNNPFANYLSGLVSPRSNDPNMISDPRSKALMFSYLGGLGGTIIGARGGIGRATITGAIGGLLGGGLGIWESHNPSAVLNSEAIADTVLASLPVVGLSAAFYGLTKVPRIGGVVAKAITTASAKTADLGAYLTPKTYGVRNAANRAGRWAQGRAAGIYDPLQHRMNWNRRATSQETHDARQAATDGVMSAAQTLVAGPINLSMNLADNVILPALRHTYPEGKGMWEQSLALGHIVSYVPHQAAVISTGAAVVSNVNNNGKKRRGKHATTTMPSNS